jgi:hypothetical protein
VLSILNDLGRQVKSNLRQLRSCKEFAGRLHALEFSQAPVTVRHMQRKELKEPAPRQHNHLPAAAESRLLEILWEIGDGTVEDVVSAHSSKERPNYKTTQTLPSSPGVLCFLLIFATVLRGHAVRNARP